MPVAVTDRGMKTPAVILAGGRATRMGGGDKSLLMLGKTSMLSMIVGRLSPQAGPLAINANGDPARFADHGLPVIADDIAGSHGPLAGILAAMEWAAAGGAAQVVTVAGDTPFLPPDLVQRLAGAAGDGGLALAASRDEAGLHEHPVIGLWPVALRDDLRARLMVGDRRVRDLTRAHGAVLVEWPAVPQDPFRNVNTPDDLRAARQSIAQAGGGAVD